MTGNTGRHPSTFSKKVKITNKLGIHARAAAVIAKLAQNAKSKIWISKDSESANAASIIDILALGCTKGSWIALTSEDPVNLHLLLRIQECVESGFGE